VNVKNSILTSFGQIVLAILLATGLAEAHGAPTLAVRPATVEAGGTMTISGDGLGETGESVLLMLQGTSYQAPLGTLILTSDAIDNADFTVPADAPTGEYVVKAQNGPISADAQLSVVAAGASHSAATSALPLGRSRAWTTAEWIVAMGLVVLSLGTAVALLWRARSDLTAIDW
jgi:hypothetical protein